jgi:L-lactate dehydrogenase
LRDQRSVLTVSAPMTGQYGVEGIAISLPTIVGRGGAVEILELPLSDEEQEAFRYSAQVLKDRLAQL